MTESYFKRPVFFDLLISISVVGGILVLDFYNNILTDKIFLKSYDFSSDIGAIGLTVSGFILTLVTILMTLKSSQIISKEALNNNSSPFKIFLASDLYFRSLNILKNGVLALIIVSFTIYIFKLVLSENYYFIIFYLNIIGLLVIITTFLRCFYVLNLIMKMQKK